MPSLAPAVEWRGHFVGNFESRRHVGRFPGDAWTSFQAE